MERKFFLWTTFEFVNDNAPKVLPWNAPSKEMHHFACFCFLNATLIAFSTASAPELITNAAFNPFGVMDVNSLRKLTCSSMVKSCPAYFIGVFLYLFKTSFKSG